MSKKKGQLNCVCKEELAKRVRDFARAEEKRTGDYISVSKVLRAALIEYMEKRAPVQLLNEQRVT